MKTQGAVALLRCFVKEATYGIVPQRATNFYPASLACIREVYAAACVECTSLAIGEGELALHDPDVMTPYINGNEEALLFALDHRKAGHVVASWKIRFTETEEEAALTDLCMRVATVLG